MIARNNGNPAEKMINSAEEKIRGKELRLTERDVYKSLSFFGKIGAFLFGGIYAIRDIESKELDKQRGIILYIPPIHTRFYWKVIYRFTHSSKKRITHSQKER